MEVELLDVLPKKFIERLKELGIEELNPAQEKAVEAGLLDGENIVVSAPTASGKTLIAILAAASNLFRTHGKVLYIVPLRALASEKFEEFQKFFEGMFKVGISTGDYDSSDPWLQEYDIIILTVEKMDSLMRHGVQWIKDVSLVIVDEIHLLNDPERGPTLEMVLTKLKREEPQILGLSATIKNVEEIGLWLDAEVVKSKYRPVKLREGILNGKKIKFIDSEEFISSNFSDELGIVEDTLKKEKQILIFVSTRKNAESLAEKLSKVTSQFVKEKELEPLCKKILEVLETPTAQCKKLYTLCKKGVVFHHAGLLNKQRKIIEDLFKENKIKAIVATPTLAAGVNLPAYRVLIRDIKRFYPGYGSLFIPVLEYQQMAGRAGRPKYDREGQALILVKNEKMIEQIFEKYIMGEPEEIYSKLAVEPILRSHILALIASEEPKEEEIFEFLDDTFYSYQYGDPSRVIEISTRIIEELIKWGFVVQINEKLIATRIGKRVSDLYIDPETAHNLIEAVKNYKANEFGIVNLLCNQREMKPGLSVKNNEYHEIQQELIRRGNKLMFDYNKLFWLDEYLETFKTSLMIEEWINEASEERIYERYGVTPGELYTRIEILDWLLYSLSELSVLIGKPELIPLIKKLRLRIKHGIKEELIELVSVRGIGRKRARKLWKQGIKSLKDLKRISRKKLAEILGEKTAEKIKEEVDGIG